jgi:hypothetical protein
MVTAGQPRASPPRSLARSSFAPCVRGIRVRGRILDRTRSTVRSPRAATPSAELTTPLAVVNDACRDADASSEGR